MKKKTFIRSSLTQVRQVLVDWDLVSQAVCRKRHERRTPCNSFAPTARLESKIHPTPLICHRAAALINNIIVDKKGYYNLWNPWAITNRKAQAYRNSRRKFLPVIAQRKKIFRKGLFLSNHLKTITFLPKKRIFNKITALETFYIHIVVFLVQDEFLLMGGTKFPRLSNYSCISTSRFTILDIIKTCQMANHGSSKATSQNKTNSREVLHQVMFDIHQEESFNFFKWSLGLVDRSTRSGSQAVWWCETVTNGLDISLLFAPTSGLLSKVGARDMFLIAIFCLFYALRIINAS